VWKKKIFIERCGSEKISFFWYTHTHTRRAPESSLDMLAHPGGATREKRAHESLTNDGDVGSNERSSKRLATQCLPRQSSVTPLLSPTAEFAHDIQPDNSTRACVKKDAAAHEGGTGDDVGDAGDDGAEEDDDDDDDDDEHSTVCPVDVYRHRTFVPDLDDLEIKDGAPTALQASSSMWLRAIEASIDPSVWTSTRALFENIARERATMAAIMRADARVWDALVYNQCHKDDAESLQSAQCCGEYKMCE
jgi:hypothetical protein